MPSGFFKVLCYRTKHETPEERLGVLAFAIFQDEQVLRDLRGPTIKTDRRYQLTISELQLLTGINFGAQLFERNPLFFYDDEVRNAEFNVPRVPERIPIEGSQNLISDHQDQRISICAQSVRPIIINSAMIDPVGNEKTGEWISLFNRTSRKKTLKDWTMLDSKGRKTIVNGSIEAGEAIKLKGKDLGTIKLGNQGGSLMLFDHTNCVMDHVSWGRNDVRRNREGMAYLFEHGQ